MALEKGCKESGANSEVEILTSANIISVNGIKYRRMEAQ